MAASILVIAFCIELALMAFSLVTKSHQGKIKTIVHPLTFSAFSVLVVSSVIPWDFRWLGLVILLFIQTGYGICCLLQNPERQKREMRSGTIVTRSVVTLLLTFIAIVSALLFPPYETPAPTGPYNVTSVRYTHTDKQRTEQYSRSRVNRQVNVVFWYPKNADSDETFPVIVFSHGGLGTENSNKSLYLELASHGYVVCSIGHPYHAVWTQGEDGRMTFVRLKYFREILQEHAKKTKHKVFNFTSPGWKPVWLI